jgi:hypothetical protein
MVLVQEIPVPLVVCPIRAALDDLVGSFAVHIKANQCIVCVVFQNRLLPIVKIIGNDGIVDRALYTTAQRIVGEIVGKTCGGDLLQLLVSHVVESKSIMNLDLVVGSIGHCATAYRSVLIDAVRAVVGTVYNGAIACLIQSIGERAHQIRRPLAMPVKIC